MWYYSYPPTEKVKEWPCYLYSVGLHELQPPIAKPHGHGYDQFFYNSHGSGTLILEGRRFPLPEGCGFFIPSGVPHEYFPSGEIWDVRWFSPAGDSLGAIYSSLGIKAGVYAIADYHKLDYIIKNMYDEIINDSSFGNVFASGNVTAFICEFARQAGLVSPDYGTSNYTDGSFGPCIPDRIGAGALKNTADAYSAHIKLIDDYVEHHFMHPIAMAELCGLTGLSAQHICRIFKRCHGMRPTEYIAKIRAEHAADLLANSSHPVSEIALWCGFENDNYFWKTFRKITGMTPGEYRKRHRGY